jgi:hypothetical protein
MFRLDERPAQPLQSLGIVFDIQTVPNADLFTRDSEQSIIELVAPNLCVSVARDNLIHLPIRRGIQLQNCNFKPAAAQVVNGHVPAPLLMQAIG